MPGYEFFPGSGALDDTVHNIINVPIMPIWHMQQKDTLKRPLGPKALVGREAYRQAITQRLLPSLRAFNPDLILLSTGFDPVEGDVGNTRSGTADGEAGMDLQPKDFEWVTSEILKIADICCSGRVVSVLEGGYGQYSELEGNDSRGFAYNQVSSNKVKFPRFLFGMLTFCGLTLPLDWAYHLPGNDEPKHPFKCRICSCSLSH